MAMITDVPRSPHVAKLVRFPPDLWERLVAAARREHRSLTLQIVHYVEEGLDRSEREQQERQVREGPRAAEERPRSDPRGG